MEEVPHIHQDILDQMFVPEGSIPANIAALIDIPYSDMKIAVIDNPERSRTLAPIDAIVGDAVFVGPKYIYFVA